MAAVVLYLHARHGKHRASRVALAPVDGQLYLTADHQLCEVVLVGLGWNPAAHDLAAADDRDAVRDLQDLVQLVADKDDAGALCGEPAEDREDLLGLLGREHRRRLVEHQDVRIPIQRLQDLDPLLPADREAAHADVRVDLRAEETPELTDTRVRGGAVHE